MVRMVLRGSFYGHFAVLRCFKYCNLLYASYAMLISGVLKILQRPWVQQRCWESSPEVKARTFLFHQRIWVGYMIIRALLVWVIHGVWGVASFFLTEIWSGWCNCIARLDFRAQLLCWSLIGPLQVMKKTRKRRKRKGWYPSQVFKWMLFKGTKLSPDISRHPPFILTRSRWFALWADWLLDRSCSPSSEPEPAGRVLDQKGLTWHMLTWLRGFWILGDSA